MEDLAQFVIIRLGDGAVVQGDMKYAPHGFVQITLRESANKEFKAQQVLLIPSSNIRYIEVLK